MRKKTEAAYLGGILLSTLLLCAGGASASYLVPQTALPGNCIPQFVSPLPVFGPAGPIPRIDAVQHPALTVTMKEIDQAVLPAGQDTCGLGVTFGKTRVWAYETTDTYTNKLLGPANWPAVTVVAKRKTPTTFKMVNNLPSFGDQIVINNVMTTAKLQGLISVDKTVHWADPLNNPAMNPCQDNPFAIIPGQPANYCSQPYTGPVPAVVHLHGAEISSLWDGGPEAWWTPNGKRGEGYMSLYEAGANAAVYPFSNSQEAGTLWFHDHALGATRTNVYSGLAAFYFLHDPTNEPQNLPSGPYEIEMAIQDRQFDTNSQFFFPDGSGLDSGTSNLNGTPGNPTVHPFWIPEFFGDVAIVNGAPWPVLNVEPRRYRFHVLDGSNARFYDLSFGTAPNAVPVYYIGMEENYLDDPVPATNGKVFLAPGERADLIVDFSEFAGKDIIVTNDAPAPYPSGTLIPGTTQPTMAKIMKFHVAQKASDTDESCEPAEDQCERPVKMVRLTDGKGHIADGVKIDKVRELICKEYADPITGQPVEVLVNNTKWEGSNSPSIAAVFTADKEGTSETPRQGSVEEWVLINLTPDAHPIHTHLTQFQILNRESFDIDGTGGSNIPGGYLGAWSAAFGSPGMPALLPGCVAGQFCPGYGPPLNYAVLNADGALGGNPAITPFLLHDAKAPNPEESGWKDAAKMMPKQVLRILVRYTPTSIPVQPGKSLAGQNFYPFDVTQGDGYVWHCHIIDHEDNDMMRPFRVQK